MSDTASRTSLARFGFQDPDRREPLHDVACSYVASLALDVAKVWFPDTKTVRVEHESPIAWHDRTVRGFADVVIHRDEAKDPQRPAWHLSRPQYRPVSPIGIEVKWGQPSVADALRQIRFYQQHTGRDGTPSHRDMWELWGMTKETSEWNNSWVWVLATPRILTVDQKKQLDASGIKLLQLDETKVIQFRDVSHSQPATPDAKI